MLFICQCLLPIVAQYLYSIFHCIMNIGDPFDAEYPITLFQTLSNKVIIKICTDKLPHMFLLRG